MRLRYVACVSVIALLAGCGSGGGNGSGSTSTVIGPGSTPTPTPTPSSTPTPTPTPTPTAAVTLVTPQVGAVTAAATLDFLLAGDDNRNSTQDWRTTQPTPGFALTYDASTRTFRLADDQRNVTFTADEITYDSAYRDGLPRIEYGLRSVDTADFLVVFKGPLANYIEVTPRYAAYGAWQHNAGGSPLNIRLDYFTYGTPTPVAAMPHTGTTTFRLIGSGNQAEASNLDFLQTDTLFNVDWAAGTITASVLLNGSNFFKDETGGAGAFSVVGTISGNGSTGNLTFTGAPGRPGRYEIHFYGPNADEMAIVYSGANEYAGFAGAAVGVRR